MVLIRFEEYFMSGKKALFIGLSASAFTVGLFGRLAPLISLREHLLFFNVVSKCMSSYSGNVLLTRHIWWKVVGLF
jgi:hypothetical protein